MKYKNMLTGDRIPVLGLGTWRMGGSMTPDYAQDKQLVEVIQGAIDLGYTHIDTAEMYGRGHTEELIGRAIQKYPRQDLFITTKIWHTNLHYQAALDAVQASLKRLHTEYVDLCLIHWPDPNTPLRESIRALDKLVSQGKVRYIGVSNFDMDQLIRAREHTNNPIVTNQVRYNLYHRTCVKNGVLEYCQDNGIILTAYSPFERGTVFSDPRVQKIADNHSVTPAQVALAWLINQPNVITIPMSTKIENLRANLAALEIVFNDEEISALDELKLPEDKLWPE